MISSRENRIHEGLDFLPGPLSERHKYMRFGFGELLFWTNLLLRRPGPSVNRKWDPFPTTTTEGVG